VRLFENKQALQFTQAHQLTPQLQMLRGTHIIRNFEEFSLKQRFGN
jgi:hypothetical protein